MWQGSHTARLKTVDLLRFLGSNDEQHNPAGES